MNIDTNMAINIVEGFVVVVAMIVLLAKYFPFECAELLHRLRQPSSASIKKQSDELLAKMDRNVAERRTNTEPRKKLKTCKTIAPLAALFITASTYASSTDDIVKNIASVMQGMKIEQVILSPETGLYEVITPNGIFYTDKAGSFVIFGGTLVDSKTKTNLTAKRTDILGAFDFANLPLADAIKTVKGDGSRVMATFEHMSAHSPS